MRRIMFCLATTVIVASAAPAAQANVCSKAYSIRQAVVKKFGKRAPGLNICRDGIKRDGKWRKARYAEKKRYLFALRALNAPAPAYAHVDAVFPRRPPAGTKTPRIVSNGGGSSNPRVNPNCESGGNPQVVSSNGVYWGKYQFDRSTWIAHGGAPGAYGNAPEYVQDQVAARVTYDAWPNC